MNFFGKIIIIFNFFYIIKCDEIILDDNNYEKILKENEINFVMAYANWCPHCQKIKSIFIEYMEENNLKNNLLKISIIEADKNKNFMEKYKIEGYPTFILIIKNHQINYVGEPDLKDIKIWLKEKINLETKKLDDLNNLENKLVFCKYNNYFELIKLKIIYENEEVFNELKECNEKIKENTINYINNNKIITFNGETFEDLRKFFINNYFIKVETANDSIFKQIFKYKINFILIHNSDINITTNYFSKLLNKNYIILKSNSNLKNKFINESIGLNNEDALIIFDTKNYKKYKYPKNFLNIEDIDKFINLFQNNKIEPYYLQENTPINNTKLLKKVVSSNFESFIADKNYKFRIILIWINDDKSPNSMKISKVFFELMDTFEMIKSLFKGVSFGEIDIKKNEIEYIDQGPIFLCFQKENQQPLVYENKDINKINITKFIGDCIGLDIIKIIGLDAEL